MTVTAHATGRRENAAAAPGYAPTGEQQAVIDASCSGKNLVVNAYAGTGKTSTLRMIAAANPRKRFVYVAYNAAAKKDAAQSFPVNARCQPDGTLVRVPVPVPAHKSVESAEVPIETLKVGDRVVSWNKTHGGIIRKRGCRITNIRTRDYKGELVAVTSDGRTSRYTPEHPCIVTMADAFDGQYLVYMMRRGSYYKIGYCSWGLTSTRNGLTRRAEQEDADALWILSAHDSRDDAAIAEALAQYEWQVPGWCFMHANHTPLDDRLWARIQPNAEQAAKCLAAFGRDITMPLWVRGNSRKFKSEALVTSACNLMDGMRALVADNAIPIPVREIFGKLATPHRVWTKIGVTREPYEGKVTSLTVETDHTYIADGILTHNCFTSHGLAFRPMSHMSGRVGGKKYVRGFELAKMMKINEPARLTDGKVLAPGQLASVVKATLRKFCYSADAKITRWHVPNDLKRYTDEEIAALRVIVPPIAQRAWDNDITTADGALPMEHDYYLKAFQLGRPRLPGDVIALDEAQDSNPCVAAMILDQIQYGTQVIMVGDTYQAIYGWRGAVDAMADFARQPGVEVLSITQSFRYGDVIAAEGNKMLTILGAPLPLRGFSKIQSRIGRIPGAGAVPDALLCRTNAEAFRRAIAYIGQGLKVAFPKGAGELIALVKGVRDIKQGRPSEHPDLIPFATYGQLQEFAENEPDGQDLKRLVELVDEHGVDELLEILFQIGSGEKGSRADVTVCTAHGAKGLEWPLVEIAGDFLPPKNELGTPEVMPREMAMLLYVALTRAKNVLDCEAVSWIDGYLAAHLAKTLAGADDEAGPAEAEPRTEDADGLDMAVPAVARAMALGQL